MTKTESDIYRNDAEELEAASEELFNQAQLAGNKKAMELAFDAINYANYAKNALDLNDIEKAKRDLATGNEKLSAAKAKLEDGK